MNQSQNEPQKPALVKPLLGAGHYYRFIYKDAEGKIGYTIVNIPGQDNELAIAKFESTFPELVWRRFEEVPCT